MKLSKNRCSHLMVAVQMWALKLDGFWFNRTKTKQCRNKKKSLSNVIKAGWIPFFKKEWYLDSFGYGEEWVQNPN